MNPSYQPQFQPAPATAPARRAHPAVIALAIGIALVGLVPGPWSYLLNIPTIPLLIVRICRFPFNAASPERTLARADYQELTFVLAACWTGSAIHRGIYGG
jgi:hypothetical protein